jgi:hypothetical protein
MVELMEFLHGAVEYSGDKQFTREELLEVGPLDVKRWLANKADGDPDYNKGLLWFKNNTIATTKEKMGVTPQ